VRAPGALTTAASPRLRESAPRAPRERRTHRLSARAAVPGAGAMGGLQASAAVRFRGREGPGPSVANSHSFRTKGARLRRRHICPRSRWPRPRRRSGRRFWLEKQAIGDVRGDQVNSFRERNLIRDTTFHDSPRHAANLQLLAKPLLLVFAIS